MDKFLEFIPFLMTVHGGKHKVNYMRLAEIVIAIGGLVLYLQYVAMPRLEDRMTYNEKRYEERFSTIENKVDKISNDIYEPKFNRRP